MVCCLCCASVLLCCATSGVPWGEPQGCPMETLVLSENLHMQQQGQSLSSHKGSCPWSASHTLPTLKLHQCCRSSSSSPSPACGSAFGWPKFDKLFLMRIAFACRAQLCQAPLSPTAAAVRGGGCPHTSSPPSQAGDMAQPSLQFITESNTVHSPWKHTPQRNTNGFCLHANTACAAQRAKGLWP